MKLLATLVLFADLAFITASAKPIAQAESTTGARIDLTDEKSPACRDTEFRAYGKKTDGTKLVGCWQYNAEQKLVLISWLPYYNTEAFPHNIFREAQVI